MSDPHADKIARRILRRLDPPDDWQAELQRLPDESEAAYYARIEAIASESRGMVSLIIFNEVAQRTSPPTDDHPQQHDFTPLRQHVIPIVNRPNVKR